MIYELLGGLVLLASLGLPVAVLRSVPWRRLGRYALWYACACVLWPVLGIATMIYLASRG